LRPWWSGGRVGNSLRTLPPSHQHLGASADEHRIRGDLHPPPLIPIAVEDRLDIHLAAERVRKGEVLRRCQRPQENPVRVARKEFDLVVRDADRGRVVGPALVEPVDPAEAHRLERGALPQLQRRRPIVVGLGHVRVGDQRIPEVVAAHPITTFCVVNPPPHQHSRRGYGRLSLVAQESGWSLNCPTLRFQ
jgi:hypothetical protein